MDKSKNKKYIIEDLFRRCAPMVFRRSLYLLGNHADAEEATQEIFVKLCNNFDGFKDQYKLVNWIICVTTNHCLNQLRNKHRRKKLLQAHAYKFSHESNFESMELLRRTLANIDEDYAQAAVYVFIDGMSHHEAAKLLGVSRRTVGNLINRFKAIAKQWFDVEQDSEEKKTSHVCQCTASRCEEY